MRRSGLCQAQVCSSAQDPREDGRCGVCGTGIPTWNVEERKHH